MDSDTFENLSDYFIGRLNGLASLINLRDASQDETCLIQLQMLQGDLNTVQTEMTVLKSQLAIEKGKLQEIKVLNEKFKILKERLNYTINHIPQRLPKTDTHIISDVTNNAPTMKPVPESKTIDNMTVQTTAPIQKQKESSNTQENTYFPEIDFLTMDEFAQVPKYLKGRLSYDQINKFIDGMNKAYKAKYKILKQKKSTLNDTNRKRYEAFQIQNTKDTKGCYFIVDEDLKEFGALKIDNVARAILTILRHCGRCREVRGGHLTRYVYIDNY